MRVIVIIALALALNGCAVVNWFKGDQSDVEPPAKLVEFKSERSVQERWSHDVGAGAGKYFIKLTPAVGDDAVFMADTKGRVLSYDVKDGKRRWKTDLKRELSAGVGLGENLVLVGSPKGEVVALNENDGSQAWTKRVSSEILVPPLVVDEVVVVQTVDGKVTGLAARDGERLWVQERSEPALSLRGTSTPWGEQGVVFTGFASGKLVAFQHRDGRILWEVPVAQPTGRSEIERLVDVDVPPLVIGDTLYAAAFHGQVAAFNLENGRTLWSREISSYTSLDADDRNLYVSDDRGHVWALDRRTGATVWKQEQLHGRQLSGPTVSAAGVAVGDYQGYVHWLARDDGRFLARHKVSSAAILARPIAAADILYVSAQDGTLAALGLK